MTVRGWLGACAAAVVLASPAALAAQQQTPEEMARAYFAHLRAGEVNRVAELTHPRALQSFQALMMRMVGEEELESMAFGGRDDVASMPADSFFLGFMATAGQEEDFTSMFNTLEVEPLGHVTQGDSLAHVVYLARLAFMSQQAQQTMILTLRRHLGGWLVDPGDGPMNMLGGGLMTLMVTAGMQAGMTGALDGGHDHDEDDDADDDDEEDDSDDDDDDDSDDDDDGDPPAS